MEDLKHMTSRIDDLCQQQKILIMVITNMTQAMEGLSKVLLDADERKEMIATNAH